jgi:hypothetical protein
VDIFTTITSVINAYESEIAEQGRIFASSGESGGAVLLNLPQGFVPFINKFGADAGATTANFSIGVTTGSPILVSNTIQSALEAIDRVRARLSVVMGYYNSIRNVIKVGNLSMAELITKGLNTPATATAANSLNLWYKQVILTSNMSFSNTRAIDLAVNLKNRELARAEQLITRITMFSPDSPIIPDNGAVIPAASVKSPIDPADVSLFTTTGLGCWGTAFTIVNAVPVANGEGRQNADTWLVRRDAADPATSDVPETMFADSIDEECLFRSLHLEIAAGLPFTWVTFIIFKSSNGNRSLTQTVGNNTSTLLTVDFNGVFQKGDFFVIEAQGQTGVAPPANVNVSFKFTGTDTVCEDSFVASTLSFLRPDGTIGQFTQTSDFSDAWQATLGSNSVSGFETLITGAWGRQDIYLANYVWTSILKVNPGLITKFQTLLGSGISAETALIYLVSVPNWFTYNPNVTAKMRDFYTELYHALLTWLFTLSATDGSTVLI